MKLQTLFIAAFLAFTGSLYAQERSFSYQGMLLDAAKQPVSGEHHITITLYDSPTGSEAIHSESFATPVVNGVFSVVVGSQTALSTSVKFDKQYWLGISVNGGAEMMPRTALTSVPYATHADAASSLTKGATGAVTSLNGVTGDLEFQGGPGTFVKTEGKTITISSAPIISQDPQSVAQSIIGTQYQVLADGTYGEERAGDVTLSLPQNIHTGATPTFAGMTLSAMPSGTSTDLLISDAGHLKTRTLASLNLATSADLASEIAARAAADANDWHVTGGNAADASSYVGTNNNTSLRLQVRGQAITNSVILNNNGSIQRFETGDARGIWAVDLQNDRYSTEQVASGDYSVIAGGRGNIASGLLSFVGGGGWDGIVYEEGWGPNRATGDWSSVVAGWDNRANGNQSFVGGGWSNYATGSESTIAGGGANEASGDYTAITGGLDNTASGYSSTVGGGKYNFAIGYDFTTVSGGYHNTASGNGTTVGGGWDNTASGAGSSIGGGIENEASGSYFATVSGGGGNTASGHSSTVGGGLENAASEIWSTVGGGYRNTASAHSSTVSGGSSNVADGELSTIPGGRGLTLSSSAISSFGINANNTDGARPMTIDAAHTAVFGNANLWLANTDNTSHELRFYEAQSDTGTFPAAGTNYTAFKADEQTTNITYTLPSALPATKGAMVATSGGALSWGSHGRVAATATTTQTINDAAVTDSNTILVTIEGTRTTYAITGRTAGTSFTITTSAALTTSDFINYQILP